MVGTQGADRLVGTPKGDTISSLGDNDRVAGREGGDFIRGGAGRDDIYSQLGDDHIVPGPAQDFIKSAGGNDVIEADDGTKDGVECGNGRADRAYLDVRPVGNADDFGNCEYVNDKKVNWDTFDYETWPEAPPRGEREF